MATVYKIEIETVSSWKNYSEESLKDLFLTFLRGRFESTTVKVTRK